LLCRIIRKGGAGALDLPLLSARQINPDVKPEELPEELRNLSPAESLIITLSQKRRQIPATKLMARWRACEFDFS
jgi:hypothetical protein